MFADLAKPAGNRFEIALQLSVLFPLLVEIGPLRAHAWRGLLGGVGELTGAIASSTDCMPACSVFLSPPRSLLRLEHIVDVRAESRARLLQSAESNRPIRGDARSDLVMRGRRGVPQLGGVVRVGGDVQRGVENGAGADPTVLANDVVLKLIGGVLQAGLAHRTRPHAPSFPIASQFG